jgi:hypothetical protein
MDNEYYLCYDLPIPYKKLNLYPVNIKEYLLFDVYSQCFTFEKNIIPDAKIISMTNLQYIYHTAKENTDTPYLLWFDRALSVCLKDDKSFEKIEESIHRYDYDKDGKPFFKIDGEIYTSVDYEEIKKIVCQQNLIELPDPRISKEVRDSLEEAMRYKAKLTGSKPGSFEDYIVSLSIATGWSFDYIYAMTARKFIKSVKRLDNLIHYKIYLSASLSGMVEFKDKSFIKHWLTDIEEKDKYGDVSMDLEVMQNKISMESAKQKG